MRQLMESNENLKKEKEALERAVADGKLKQQGEKSKLEKQIQEMMQKQANE